ncbi:M20 family metallopeptidase [Clostridium sp. P21]|uniref:Probable succinyl-diaminopimelate desuccinylase n=1 Tax=Clostridium muellerianum TaxID=2716538 RepID=A0A7Y0EEI7_9CLOT|nr:M20 family metallopeptidase [Clostridium muellerianum]NMM61911.1 M20 family metallopeptidase [Clostridium muellerianum]
MNEKSMWYLSDSDFESVINITSDLVKLESTNPPGFEEEVGKYLVNFFNEASIETKIFPVEKGRFDVVAKIPGKDSKSSIAFTGHMDVVPVSEKEYRRWNILPFSGEVKDGFIYGRGSSDMKGGLASAMVAMSNIVKKGVMPPNDIYLIATVDEEDSMKGSKALLNEHFLSTIELLVVCEPTGLEICTAGKGRTYANICITGKTGHGSQGKGFNAIEFARKLMNKMQETSFQKYENTSYGSSFWQPISINAAVEPCVVPDELVLKVDARLVPDHRTEDVWMEMRNIIDSLKKQNPGYDAVIDIIDQREGWKLPMESSFLSKIKKIYDDLNITFKTTFFAGTTDGSIFRKKGVECIIVGPGELSAAHKENECVSIEKLIQGCKLYYNIMLKR